MKAISIKHNWITKEKDLRLGADYHLSDGPKTKRLFENAPIERIPLSKAAKDIFLGSRFKRVYVEDQEKGYPYLTGSDMVKTNLDSGKYLSKKYTGQQGLLMIDKGLILISCSGTLGNTVFTNDDFVGRIGTHDLIRIIPNEEKVLPGFLYAFLSSTYGYSLLVQPSYGGVVKHIEPHHIADLPVPIFPEDQQQRIHDLIVQAGELRVEANRLLAESILAIEAPYQNLLKKKALIYTVNIKEIFSGDKYTHEKRLEADHYQPITKKLIERIKNAGKWNLLGDVTSEIKISNLRGRSFVKKGVVLFTGQSLGLLNPDLSKQLSRKLTRNIEENITKDGDILISAFGTIGKVELAYKNFYSEIFASQQIARIRTLETGLHPGYLFAFLSSKLGLKQMLKYKTGSVIEWLNSHNFASIVVAIPSDNGLSIGEKVFEAILNRQKAFVLETQAITLIETEIASWQS